MKAKYLVITFLLALLALIVYQMMRYESDIRSDHIVKIKVQDDSKPLIREMPHEQLYEQALKAEYSFMAKGAYFKAANIQILLGKKTLDWEPLFLKGVNLGVAMPGKYATEFTLSFDEYLNWFSLIGKMNANVIRIYTVLPPEFYEAFCYYNLHNNDKKLYLLQGVWIEEPEESNYYHAKTQREFQKEIIDVLDVIHGNAVIEPRAGHASGTYASNISSYVIGIILGREWEPKAVSHTNLVNALHHYTGEFISVNNATAMEVWLAQMMDFTVLYETQRYAAQRPISFVNWLTLDPMYHTTEFIENKKIKEYDNDKESIDLRKFNASDLFAPGIFASYHVYPYYPDFIYLQKSYADAKNRYGQKDNFTGYLQDLKAHHPGMPLVIAEYGLPSSRGNSHYTPDGFNQGGLSEKEQNERSELLTYDIADTHCAGAIFFEWIDEWFKFNWLVMDFEQPMERRMFWHNMENPEKNFGVMAIESKNKILDGKLDDWKNISTEKDNMFIECDADASYFYIVAHLPSFDFSKNKFHIALDTYDKKKGDHQLPFLKEEIANGIEFLLDFNDTANAKILVDDQYSVYTDIYNAPVPVYGSKENNNGKFIEEFLLANRGKISLLGDTIKPIVHNRSRLIFGNNSKPESSNADWFWNNKTKNLEIRLTWHLINVSDPSQRYVLDDQPGTPDIEYTQTPGITLIGYETTKNEKILNEVTQFCTWEPWEKPSYQCRLKPIYYGLQKCFENLPKPPEQINSTGITGQFTITPFYQNKTAAISLSFSANDEKQYVLVLPALEKYGLKATFGLVATQSDSSSKQQKSSPSFKEIDREDIRTLVKQGHEIALQMDTAMITKLNPNDLLSVIKSSSAFLKGVTGTTLSTVQYPTLAVKPHWVTAAYNSGAIFVQTQQKKTESANLTPATVLMKGNDPYSCKALDSTLNKAVAKWTIFNYLHVREPIENQPYRSLRNRDKDGVNYELFERHIRLYRNAGYWIAPIASVEKYLKEKEASTLSVVEHDNLILLNVKNKLDSKYDQPLTIAFITAYKKLKITNSAADGIYEARDGKINFDILPNREVIIEILEK
jgi:peptidoglycan/xylan/chitin deacetylase (PgdA/CDA1 family)